MYSFALFSKPFSASLEMRVSAGDLVPVRIGQNGNTTQSKSGVRNHPNGKMLMVFAKLLCSRYGSQ